MLAVSKLKLDPDATHLFSLWGAVEEYLFRYKRDTQDLVLLHCLTLLVSLKNQHHACAERLLEVEPDFGTGADSAHAALPRRIWLAAGEVAPRIRRRREILSLDISGDNTNLRLFSWVAQQWHETLARLLLEAFGIVVGEEFAPWSSLEVAAGASHIAALAFHLSEPGINHSALSRWGPNLVKDAAEREDLIVLDMLLKAGSAFDGSRILSDAIFHGRDAIVSCLWQAGVDVNQGDALQNATWRSHEATVDILFQAGARDNGDGLMVALRYEHESIAYKYLEAGGPIPPETLRYAIESGFEGIACRILLSGTNLDLSAALIAAIENGNEVMVDKLLKAGAKFAEDCPLMWAIRCRREAIVRSLLQAGADTKGQSLLSEATEYGERGIVYLLLQAGADYMIDDALAKAAQSGDEEIVDMLLHAGADIDACAALAQAVRCGHNSIVEKLLQAGASVSTDTVGSAPLVAAIHRGDKAQVVMLLKAGASLGPLVRSNSLTAIQSAVNNWDLSLVDLVLQEFAEDNPQRG